MSRINPISSILPQPGAPVPRSVAQSTTDFAGVLETAQELDAAAEDRGRTAANQLVATALVQPILAELRNSPFKSDLFDGGRAEEVFGQQLDTVLAERIASSAGFGASSALVAQLSGGRHASAGAAGEVDLHG